MIKGYIFDYGGTLDTAGRHWGKVLWQAYREKAAGVSEEQFREAYVHGERTLGSKPIIKPDFTFHKTLDTKLMIEMEYLAASCGWNVPVEEREKLRREMLESIYEGVKRQTAHSREVLEELSRQYPMVLVSNFYGNINVVLKEFRLDGFFKSVIESGVVGIRKPDPRIFTLGVEALGMAADETVVVGDSFSKDIIPGMKAGCNTIWIKGEGWTEETFDETIPGRIITDLSQLAQ